ncbi:MAG: PIN domain-containing protein [Lachnospiraceae bacterium]|nr:PIN domain-containing protein [Lachnospiraceae bacterium]
MKLLIDTNIIMDFFEKRSGAEAAKELFMLAEDNSQYECVTSSSVTDVLYLLAKAMKKSNAMLPEEEKKTNREIASLARERVELLLSVIHVLPTTEKSIKSALALKWNDTEDALQYIVAKENLVDVIITNNKDDYECKDIKVMTAKEFLDLL